jgi:hypothetical protein
MSSNILNKQSRTVDKECSSTTENGIELITIHHQMFCITKSELYGLFWKCIQRFLKYVSGYFIACKCVTMLEIVRIYKSTNKTCPHFTNLNGAMLVLLMWWVKDYQHARRSSVCEVWGSHGGEDDDVVLPGYDTAWSRKYIPTFRRNILSPSSGLQP